MHIVAAWGVGFAAALVLMIATWVASAVRRDASIVDRVWGLAFVGFAWAVAFASTSIDARGWIVLVAVSIWGLRLSAYITWRNWGEGEDKRYAAMRQKRPDTFTWRSLVTVFFLQAVIASVAGVALLGALVGGSRPPLGWLDAIAVGAWLIGFFFETVGDAQLARFQADPTNRTRVLNTGLWRYTRHPNYFGDTVVWVAYGLFAVAAGAWWGMLGSLIMGLLIVKVSGVALTDRSMATATSKRAGYDAYVRRTNAFIPGRPRN